MTLDAYLDDPTSRFATVAMTDTNGLLRGQMVSVRSLAGIARAGMGMSPVTFALDPTDVVLNIPGVSDETSDFHDDPLVLDPSRGPSPAMVRLRGTICWCFPTMAARPRRFARARF